MRKLIYYVAVSIDGFIAAPDGTFDFFPFDGDHAPWIIENYPESMPGHLRGRLGLADTPPRAFDTVLMGRTTHQIAVDEGLASGYPHLRQYVFTSHPDDLPTEEGLSASADDPVELVRRLKAEDSALDIWLCGGGALAATLLDEIDELRLKVNPLVLGDGIPLIGARSGGPGPAAPSHAGSADASANGVSARPFTKRLSHDFESGVTYTEYARD